MEIRHAVFAIIGSTLLCIGWLVVQMIARRMKTKNLFDNMPSCGHCVEDRACDETHCEKSELLKNRL